MQVGAGRAGASAGRCAVWERGRWAARALDGTGAGRLGAGCAAQHGRAQGALGGLGTALRHRRLGGLGAPVRVG